MAQIVFSDCDVSVANITIPANGVKSCTITPGHAKHDNTGMGHTAKSSLKGMQDWKIELEIFADFTTMDAELWAINNGTGDVGAIAIKPTSEVVGASNPSYESTAGFLEDYSPISAGSVGEQGVWKLTISSMGAELTREVT